MIELELDGKTVNANPGSTILEVALREGKYVPHFCYHKKLSIAANCRMCLVEVEKAPKPLPACATPVTEGMKVHTCSKVAVEAQQGVMEFLLINHPLDCPICDQGGECQLQDLAVGYGRSKSRFHEEKRAVSNKDLGSLVATEMTRCIHCSRCVRFTEEIAGYQELGMSYRNNHVEVMPFIGKTLNSELSGNVIDICPVGALTSKPFRNQYRSWELSRRKSIAPHDGLGSNLILQVDKYHKVVRVLPYENENINECWLSDRDRFSYEGLYHSERVTKPMIKQDGIWHEVEWDTAINYVAKTLNDIKAVHGADMIGVLANSTSTTEELYLLQKLMRKFEVNNIDNRLSQSDFTLDANGYSLTKLGDTLTNFVNNKSILIIGSNLREEQPLIAARVRQAVNKKGLELNVINIFKEDLLCNLHSQIVVDSREIASLLAEVVLASGDTGNLDLSGIKVSAAATKIAKSLKDNKGHIVIGEIAKTLPNYSEIVLLVEQLAKNVAGHVGAFNRYANELGSHLVGAVPYKGAFTDSAKMGLNALQMLQQQLKAYVLLDSYNSNLALKALRNAGSVIMLSAFTNENIKEYADVILPITPYTETAGSFVNMLGNWQKFNGVTKPLGMAKPGWKVLRVLANALNIEGFEYNSIEDVRVELAPQLNQEIDLANHGFIADKKITIEQPKLDKLVRFGVNGIYTADSIVRRSKALQQTLIAKLPTLAINQKLADKIGVKDNNNVTVIQDGKTGIFTVNISADLPDTMVLFATNNATCGFAGRFDNIEIKVG
jgi:NADH-quinone oxidoreductase subunit G